MTREQKQEEIENMKRVWSIVSHPSYQRHLEKNKAVEKDRKFCVHDMQHFLDVARLAYIFKMERNYNISKEMIYASAFLHDIGRWQQYEMGIPHEIASIALAEPILEDAGFEKREREEILLAIHAHRKEEEKSLLAEIIYDADKISRSCYMCEARKECNWEEGKKNVKVIW